MDIIDVYKSILQCGGMSADHEGFISLQFANEKPRPVVISTKEGDKRLVLPIDDQLRHGDMTKRIVFHPLVESLHRGESEVGEKLRESIGMNLNMSLCYIAISLLTLSTSHAEHQKLSPDQTVFMSAVKDADEATIERLIKISEHMALGDAQKSFVHIYIKRGAIVKGKKYHRAAMVSFPFYEELKKIPEPKHVNEVFGVRLRKVDREALTNLLEYMIPGIDHPENFISTSNSDVAPYLDALLGAMAHIAIHINAISELFNKKFEGGPITFDLDWQHAFKDLEKLKPQIRMIPQQAGNEGKLPKSPIANKIISVDTPMPTHAHHQAQEVKPPQGQASSKTFNSEETEVVKKIDHFGRPYEERLPVLAASTTTTQTQPTHYPNPYQPPQPNYPAQYPPQYPPQYTPPMGGYAGVQGYQTPAMVNPDAIVRTANGTDFRSILNARPDLAAVVGMMPRPGFAQPQQGNVETPRWAMGGFSQGYNTGSFGNI